MNREIKFRGKPILAKLPSGQKIYDKFVYGDLITGNGICRIFVPIEGGFKNYEVDPETVGQYTGQKDRNGKEIYEGDIIKDESGFPFSGNCIVEWDSFYCQYQYTTIGMTSYLEPNDCAKPVILGNIWDNPELLEDRK